MVVKMQLYLLLVFLIFILAIINKSNAVTHWVVTETGRIQAYLDSPYEIRRPYDLLALLDQETRSNDINVLYNDLIKRKTKIETKWSSLEGVEKINSRCLDTDNLVSDLDLLIIAYNGSERTKMKIDFPKIESKNYNIPECQKFSTIENNLNIFDNMPNLKNRSNVVLYPLENMKKFLPTASLKQFGHAIAEALSKNSSSWYHYNLATFYWRIKGEGQKAISCIERAIQYVPREYRDIPLHNLAGILFQAKLYKEASVFLQAAVEQAPNEAMHYYALGNVFSQLRENNKSILYFEKYFDMRPDQKEVANKHPIYCVLKLENGLMNFQESLEEILSELHDYHSQQQQWLRLQERLMWEQASFDLQLDGGFAIELSDSVSGKKVQRCIQKGSNNFISCNFYNKISDFDKLNVQEIFNSVENEKQKLNIQINSGTPLFNEKKEQKKKKSVNSNNNGGKVNIGNSDKDKSNGEIKSPPILYPKFPTTMSTSNNQYFDRTGWPSKDECLNWNLPINEKDDLNLPVFLPPENKGYQVKKILSEYINLAENAEHPLPWYPPVCEQHNVFGDKYVPSNERQALNNELKSNSFLRKQLLQYVNDGKGDEAEIGQRIITAMEKKIAPRWVLATLASLYWRIRGNARRALDCLDVALQVVPEDPTDVVLVSIGSVVYQMGFVDQAIKFATVAFKINYVEPSTNFLLALIHYTNNNPLLAMYYMKNVLRVDPDYYDGRAELLLKTWGCRIKIGGYNSAKHTPEKVEGMCTKKESFKGEGVICSPNGDHCKTAAIQCYQTNLGGNDAIHVKSANLPCNGKNKIGLGHSLISSILAAEGAENIEPDQSKLESLTDANHAFHMRLSLGEEHPSHQQAGLGDFYVSVSLTDNTETESLLHVYDKYGTYSLSPSGCKKLEKTPFFKYSTIWPSIVSRSFDLTPYLKPIPKDTNPSLEPICDEMPHSPLTLDHLSAMILRHSLSNSPEKELLELLALMASDHKSSIKDFAVKLALALAENKTSWILATASALYWRIVGNTEQAVTCLAVALVHSPSDMKDIPLISLANLLDRVGFHSDALEAAHMALKTNSNFVFNHYTVGNIHVSMHELEKAVVFYRASLAIDSNFEPARHRLQLVLCSLLFDDGDYRDHKQSPQQNFFKDSPKN